ncbi:sulfotransferase domain-containing protein [Gymnodinialimonas sp.]
MPSGRIDWLASYPKSGNTWMRMLLANYFNETDQPQDINAPGVTKGIASSRMRFDDFLGINSSDLTMEEIKNLQPEVYRMMTDGAECHQWIKVHDAQLRNSEGQWLFPPEVTGVVVYLIRNPLDVVVSMAFHDGHQDIDQSIAKLCSSATVLAGLPDIQLPQQVGCWSEHVKSWVDQDDMPALVVRYEDLLSDTAAKFVDVLEFARPDAVVDRDKVAQAVAHSEFDRLSAAEGEFDFREKPQKAAKFFRKGVSGDWRNHLNSAQVAKICDVNGSMMERFGYADEGGMP